MATLPITFTSGGGGSDEVTATKAQVLAGYTAITSDSDDEPAEGTIPSLPATTYYATLEAQNIIPSGKYTAGAQTVAAVSTSGFLTAAIKAGHTINISNGNEVIRTATGTYTSSLSTGQTGAAAGQILSGYSAYYNGSDEIKGSISSKGAQTYYVASSDRTIAAGQYLSGAQTIKAVTTAGISAGNIRKGVTVKVGDASDDDRLVSVPGTYSSVLSEGQTAAAAGQIMKGYSAFVNGGSEMKGTIEWKSGSSTAWKNFESNSVVNYPDNGVRMQVPAAGYYNTYSYIYTPYSTFGDAAAGNVLSGKTFTSSAGFKATGSMANKGGSSTTASQQSATVDADTTNSRIRMKIPAAGYYNTYSYLYSAYSTFGNAGAGSVISGATFTSSAGFKATGTMANKGGKSDALSQQSATVDADTTNSRIRMKIPAAGYYNGYSYLYSAYSTFGNATAAQVLKDKTFTSSAGFKATGTIETQAGKTVYATTSDQTAVAASHYCSGAIKVSKLTATNLASGNILRGKTITINNGNANVWSVSGSTSVLKVVSGSATLGTSAIAIPNDSGVNYNAYYASVNPGITPVEIFTISDNLYVHHNVPQNTGNLCSSSPAKQTAIAASCNVNSVLPASSSSVRLPGRPASSKVWYFIYGY